MDLFLQLTQMRQLVQKLFEQITEDETHGYEHALRVYDKCTSGLIFMLDIDHTNSNEYEQELPGIDEKLRSRQAIYFAGLLHDVDDPKIFPESKDYKNARYILKQCNVDSVDLVINMIKLVSFSKNNLNASEDHIPKWQLIPRDADRLEAIGEIGIARCIAYGNQCGRPLYTFKTKRCKSIEEIQEYAKHCYENKVEVKCSLDYFYSGLVPRGTMFSGVKYFEGLAEQRLQPIYKLLLIFGEKGYIDKHDVLSCITEDQMAINLINKYMK